MKVDYGALMILVTGILYAASTTVFFVTARPWLAITYFGYTVGNVGLFMIALGHK